METTVRKLKSIEKKDRVLSNSNQNFPNKIKMNRLVCATALFCLLISSSLALPADISSPEASDNLSTEAQYSPTNSEESSLDSTLDSLLNEDYLSDEKTPESLTDSKVVVDKGIDESPELPEVPEVPDVPFEEETDVQTLVPKPDSDSLTETKPNSVKIQSSGQITRVGQKGPCKYFQYLIQFRFLAKQIPNEIFSFLSNV